MTGKGAYSHRSPLVAAGKLPRSEAEKVEMAKIEEKFYAAGLNAFAEGKKVRDVLGVLERLPEDDTGESKGFSFVAGFLDGLIARIRNG